MNCSTRQSKARRGPGRCDESNDQRTRWLCRCRHSRGARPGCHQQPVQRPEPGRQRPKSYYERPRDGSAQRRTRPAPQQHTPVVRGDTPRPNPRPRPSPRLPRQPCAISVTDRPTLLLPSRLQQRDPPRPTAPRCSRRVGATNVTYIPQLRTASRHPDRRCRLPAPAYTAVASVESYRIREIQRIPNDHGYAGQWALPKIGWDSAYGTFEPAGSATVAVLDTCVDPTADLRGQPCARRLHARRGRPLH